MEDQINFESRIDFTSLHEKVARIREQMSKVIVGQREVADLLLTAMLADGHILIEGVPGIAKTLMAKVMARMLDVSFNRIQFTPDLMPSDITGLNVYSQKDGEFHLVKGPVFTNVLLADEINRATPRTQASLLEAMEEKQVTIDGETLPLAEPFLVQRRTRSRQPEPIHFRKHKWIVS